MSAGDLRPPGLILLVEDNRADVTLIRQSLKEHNVEHELMVVTDGDTAFDFIEKVDADATVRCPDVVLLDLNLPKRGGDEVLARVRESSRFALVPVVITSSASSKETEEMSNKFGAINYFGKPTDLDEFLTIGLMVKNLLQGNPNLKVDSPAGEQDSTA